ncbi:transglutaminaseTgpA domain-containing protein [Comamonas sp. GCA5]
MDSTTPPLPRETRDTLLVLGVVALVLLPQVAYLPPWASALAALLLGWRMWLARSGQRLPGTWLLAALLALAVGATALQFRSIVGPEAGVVLVILLLVLKTLEMRARRDAMVIFFLGFFTLLTLFLQSQSLSMALAMLVAVWGLLVCLVNAHMPSGYPSLRQLVRTAGLLILLGAP